MTQAIISDFTFRYPGSEQTIIDNLNLKLETGSKPTRVALVASNGVGKTTILNQLWETSFASKSKVKLPDSRIYFTQHIPNFELNPQSDLENYFQFLLEDFQGSYESAKWYWLLDRVSGNYPKFKHKMGSLLLDLGLIPSSLPNKFEQLSPGTKKKFLLASLLATEPDLILADELTNHLDKQAIQIITKQISQSNSAWLVVDHNQYFLSQIVNHFVFIPDNLSRQPVHFKGGFWEFEEFLQDLREKQEQDYKKLNSEQKKLKLKQKKIQELARLNPDSSKLGAMKKTVNRKLEVLDKSGIVANKDANKRVDFGKSQKQKPKKSLLISSPRSHPLTYQIGVGVSQSALDFALYKGQRMRLIGPNGRGKSSLVKAIKTSLNRLDLKSNFAQYLSGDLVVGDVHHTEVFCLEQITDYPKSRAISDYLDGFCKLNHYTYQNFLNRLELSKFTPDNRLDEMSLGEFIRFQVGILAKKIQSLQLIILDEPGNYLDVYTQASLVKLLESYSGSLLLITHDDLLAAKIGYDTEFELG